MTEQNEHLEWRGDTGENDDVERQLEAYEDYCVNGGTMTYDEWYAEQMEKGEYEAELRMEEEEREIDG